MKYFQNMKESDYNNHVAAGHDKKIHNQAGAKIRALRNHNMNIIKNEIKFPPHSFTRKNNITLNQTKIIVKSFYVQKNKLA